jgi:signal transduction histidine kinase
LRIPIESTRITRQGDGPGTVRGYAAFVMSRVMPSAATIRRIFAARRGTRLLLDIALAAAVFGMSLVLLSHTGAATDAHVAASLRPGSRELDQIGVALAACAAAPLVAWRRFPLGVFVVSAAAGVLLIGLGYSVKVPLGPAAALYLLAANREWETPWTRRSTAFVAGLFAAYVGAAAVAEQSFLSIGLILTTLSWAVAWFAGERTRLRRAQLAELQQRARRAERDAERERLLAVAEERARIARDLHDSAGHAISLIAVRAGAARLRHRQDQDRSLEALNDIEELARHTVADIDQIVGTLRDGSSANDDVEAPPGLASLDTLVTHHTAAGLEIDLRTVGTPQPLSAAADQAAYRILQQALTNAAYHGSGNARIELAFTDAAIELTITNPVDRDGAPRPGGGHGLIGMRERATLLGGSMDTERVNGTYRVHAQIPYGGHRT